MIHKSIDNIIKWTQYFFKYLINNFLVIFISGVLFLMCGILVYFIQGRTVYYQMDFELIFDNLSSNQYPNRLVFNTRDILQEDVLKKVFNDNDLDEIMDYSDFVNNIAVIQRGDTFYGLQELFFPELENPDIDLRQRMRLEAEYASRLDSAFEPYYSMVFLYDIPGLSTARAGKVFNDVLYQWNELSIEKRGVFLYDRPIITTRILQYDDYLGLNQSWFIRLDNKRTILNILKQSIESLGTIPSSKVAVSKNGHRINDILFNIEAIERHRILPLLSMTEYLEPNEKVYAGIYVQSMLDHIGNDLELFDAIRGLYRSALDLYLMRYSDYDLDQPVSGERSAYRSIQRASTGITLFDNIINIIRMNIDYPFRQDLIDRYKDYGIGMSDRRADHAAYQMLSDQIEQKRDPGAGGISGRNRNEFIDRDLNEIRDQLSFLIDEYNDLFYRFSSEDLATPSGRLYETEGFAMRVTERNVGLIKITLVSFILWAFFISVYLGIFAKDDAFAKNQNIGTA